LINDSTEEPFAGPSTSNIEEVQEDSASSNFVTDEVLLGKV